MDLTPYVDSLRHDLRATAAAGTPETQATADLLSGALDAALRLCLVDALSALAAEVTAASDVEVEIRMHGREPQAVITTPPAVAAITAEPDDDDGSVARVTVRLPESLKERAERGAAAAGLSVNAWMVRAIAAATQPTIPTRGPRRTTGFARS